jgi:hypothetical protein
LLATGALVALLAIVNIGCVATYNRHVKPRLQPYTELVMEPGMTIHVKAVKPARTITNLIVIEGGIAIHAADVLTRCYTWEDDTRCQYLRARKERWFGSLGAYSPGLHRDWPSHNGVVRGVLEEGQRHFDSEGEAIIWLENSILPYGLWTRDGLVIECTKRRDNSGAVRTLAVNVWQIYIGDEKPTALPGSRDDLITVEYGPPVLLRPVGR